MQNQTITRPNAAQSRAHRLSQRFTAHTIAIASDLSQSDALEAETLSIDEAAREIDVNRDTIRLENEISCLRVRLRYATGADLLNVRERLSEARLDLMQVQCELMGE